jgi:UDP-glucuronate 4-epimerase
MRYLVTGGAGFIGSHLVDRLLLDGHEVVAVDDFDPVYPRYLKEANLRHAWSSDRFRLLELDLARDDLAEALEGVQAVAHLAARANVRDSFGGGFSPYLDRNVLATQRLLEAVKGRGLKAFVYASSASVYGDWARVAVDEAAPTRPHSPYGVTKLAGEHLALLYERIHNVPACSLRYFSVYGPRERPDKGIQIFLTAARDGREVTIFGDGAQQRDFTYVGDVVQATVTALQRSPRGEVLNLGRGRTEPLTAVLQTIERVTGLPLKRRHGPSEPGDVRVTAAVIERARQVLDYVPQVDLEVGIRRQWEHVQRQLPSAP